LQIKRQHAFRHGIEIKRPRDVKRIADALMGDVGAPIGRTGEYQLGLGLGFGLFIRE
jgi:hypothetical protein